MCQLDESFGCPKKNDIDRDSVSADIGDGCFNHPVVMPSVDPVEKKAPILIVSVLIFKPPKTSDLQSHTLRAASSIGPEEGELDANFCHLAAKGRSFKPHPIYATFNANVGAS